MEGLAPPSGIVRRWNLQYEFLKNGPRFHLLFGYPLFESEKTACPDSKTSNDNMAIPDPMEKQKPGPILCQNAVENPP